MTIDISIKGEGLTYTSTTSIIKASQIIAFLNAGTEMTDSRQSANQQSTNSQILLPQNSNKSPMDALLESNAKNNMQKILVFAKYHIEKTGGLTFDPQEIKVYFKKAGEGEPRNYGRDIRDAVSLNYIYEENTGEYVITDYGNKLLELHFEGESKNKQNRNRQVAIKNTSRKAPILKVSDSVANLEIIPKLDGVISYHDVNKKGDKILWILYFASQNSIPNLSPTDIEYIADKLFDKIPISSLSALSQNNRKLGYLTKTKEGKFKLLYDGIEYIKKLQKVSNVGSVSNEVEGK